MIYSHKVEIGEIKGEIKVELLSWQERTKKAKDIVYKIENNQLVEKDLFDQGEASVLATVEQIREVNVSFGEKIISNIDELLLYKEGMQIINEISPIVLNGVSLAKN